MLGIGIIGSGVGIRTHAPGFLQTGNARLVTLFSPNFSKAQRLAEERGFARICSSYQEVCTDPDVDLVVIASPNSFHYEHTAYALNSGKHVLCEKPLTCSISSCSALVELATQHPTQFAGVNNQLRFNPYILAIKRVIESGELGNAFHARFFQQGVNAADPGVPWSWSFDSSAGGGVRWAMGSHLVDLVNYLFQRKVASVFGSLHTVVPTRHLDGVATPVNASAEFSGQMLLDNGLTAFVSAVAAAHSGFKFEIDVFFEKGQLHFDLDNKLTVYSQANELVVRHFDIPGIKEGELSNKISFFAGTFRYYADDIVSSLAGNSNFVVPNAATFLEALETIRILEAFLESYKGGESVSLHPLTALRDSV